MIDERDLNLLLGRPIIVNRGLIMLMEDHMAAIMLGQAFYWTQNVKQNQQDRQGWFYKSQREWFEETGLTRGQQERARKKLREFDFWEEELRGDPVVLWFRIDLPKLAKALSICSKRAYRYAHNEHIEKRKVSKSICSKRANHHAKNTSEITSKNSAPRRGKKQSGRVGEAPVDPEGFEPVSDAEREYLKNFK